MSSRATTIGRIPPSDSRGPVVELRNATKIYDRTGTGAPWRSLVPFLPEHRGRPHVAVTDIDLVVEPGEAVGFIGPNGAGKSTLLKLVAGVTRPTFGQVVVRGDVGSMIELGLGFHPDLTGRENLRCGAVVHGHSSMPPIVQAEVAEFAGLEDVLDLPLKQYSLGMRARLAFAMATQFPVDVLAVDEVLAVGDRDFQERCLERIQKLRRSGTAVLFVSHEMSLVTLACERVLHLREGAVVDEGDAVEVVGRYLTKSPNMFRRDPDPSMRIHGLGVTEELEPWGRFHVSAEVEVLRPTSRPSLGVDLSLPTVAPDLTSAACITPAPELSAPGRYAVTGTSSRIGFENALIRFRLSALDGMSVSDIDHRDSHLLGGRVGGRPSLAVDPHWEVTGSVDESVVLGARQRDVAGAALPAESSVVRARNVTKRYGSGRRAALHAALPGRMGRAPEDGHCALHEVDLDITAGESVGIIGPNGAGKSTLLRVLAGIVRPDVGVVHVAGQVVPMLGIGTALQPEMTGIQNLRVAAEILGLHGPALSGLIDQIASFSGLGDVLHVPVKQYSSGMQARLALSVAVHAPGQVLLIDEMLATGDEDFRRLAVDAVARRSAAGDTVVFVSHELQLVEQLCERVIRLERGAIVDDGPAAEVIDAYGGASWAGGTMDATGGVRLLGLSVAQRHVPVGGSVVAEGVVVVDEPNSAAHLEVSYRSTPGDRSVALSLEDREVMSLYVRTIEPAGGLLTRVGRHSFRMVIDRNEFAGGFDLVLAAVDEREGVVLSEAWQQVMVGAQRPEGFPGPVLDFDWCIRPAAEAERRRL